MSDMDDRRARKQAEDETGCGECGVERGEPCRSDCTADPEPYNPPGRTLSPDEVLCRFCGVTIHERPSKSRGTVWTRKGQGGPMVICEHAPDNWHHPNTDSPEHGHTFRIEVTSRGSYAVEGVEGHTDADWMDEQPMSVEVRAWSLPDALRTAAAVFPSTWHLGDDDV